MRNKTYYTGIDYFRILAAVFVVAIHTSPLTGIWDTGDFIFTRIIARVAVPFFFMTSGFFLLAKEEGREGRLWRFIKKNLLLYGVAILLYFPIMIYSGYFSQEQWYAGVLQDLLLDGTFYHLWYFPAVIIGAVIAWALLKHTGKWGALGISAVLYVIGLFGDSYYGLVTGIPVLQQGYDFLFRVIEYTRNGIFFAPLYLVLGALAVDCSVEKNKSFKKPYAVGFGLSALLLFAEGLLLHFNQVQRHDSMYVFLVPCMFFLFSLLLGVQGKNRAILRPISTLIYLLHPMMIIVVRGGAKVVNLEHLLIENNLIHFIAVLVASIVVSVGVIFLYNHIKKNRAKKELERKTGRAWTEVDLAQLKHNILVLQKMMVPGCEMMAVVKAEAYGHGAIPVSKVLNQMGVKTFAVAAMEEGIQLRKHGIHGDILILGYTHPSQMKLVKKYNLIQTVINTDYAQAINAQKVPVKVHLKVDTGMHRAGIWWENTEEIVACCSNMPYLKVCGMYTHFCSADSLAEEDVAYTKLQNQRFESLIATLQEQGISFPKLHCQSSYGLLNYPELQWDYARLAIVLFGAVEWPDIKPVLSLKSRLGAINQVPAGEGIGYNQTFFTERDSRLGIVTIGYADGVPRNLEPGQAYVLIHGKRAPIVGRICMDQLIVDVTDLPEASQGDVVTLIGCDGDEEITAIQFANWSHSIPNEILSRMGTRLERVIL